MTPYTTKKTSFGAGTLKFLMQFHWYSTEEENRLNLNFTLNELGDISITHIHFNDGLRDTEAS